MALDPKYNNPEIDGITNFEPIFILRARDKAALSTLFHYWSRCHDVLGSPDEHLDSVEDAIGRFQLWQSEHRSEVKVPD